MENKIQGNALTAQLDDLESSNLNITTALNITYVDLPSQEEFIKQNEPSILMYQMNKWSEARYACPECKTGGMRKEQDMVYTSNPPCYRYECDKCGYSTFHHF